MEKLNENLLFAPCYLNRVWEIYFNQISKKNDAEPRIPQTYDRMIYCKYYIWFYICLHICFYCDLKKFTDKKQRYIEQHKRNSSRRLKRPKLYYVYTHIQWLYETFIRGWTVFYRYDPYVMQCLSTQQKPLSYMLNHIQYSVRFRSFVRSITNTFLYALSAQRFLYSVNFWLLHTWSENHWEIPYE